MIQHKPVLTDDDINDFFRQFRHIRFTCLDTMNYALAKGIEQSVLAKLAEQEPVVYRFLPPGTQQYMYITDDVPKIKEFEPLYAHPPMLTDHIADVSKMVGSDHIADMRKKVPDGWQLVPKDPTHAMLDKMQSFEGAGVYVIYYAALEASPKYAGDSDDQ